MHIFRTLSSTLVLVVIFGFISTEALAKKPGETTPSVETQTVLSNKAAVNLAKNYLSAFLEVDPNITLNDLKSYILNLNTTNQAEIDAAMQSYLLSLQPPAPVNQPPSISGTPMGILTEGDSYTFTPIANDPEGDNLVFSITNKPIWATFDSNSGRLSGTAGVGTAGVYGNILISVSDGALSDTLPAFAVTVNQLIVGSAPTLISAEISNSNVVLDWSQENNAPDGGYDIFIDDVDTGSLYHTTSTSQTIGNLDLSLSHCFTVEARYVAIDEFYSSNQLCTEAQAQPNQPPLISGTPSTTVSAGESYLFTPASSDADGDTLSFTILNLPEWASFDSQTGTLSGTPGEQDAGSYTDIEIVVSDAQASVSLTPFTLVVEATPVMSSTTLSWIAPSTRTDGSPLSLSEIDGYRIYMGDSETALAPVMDINDQTLNQYTVTNLTNGTHYFSVTAYDTDGNESAYSNIVMKSTL
jgi:hypothetical protein